MASNLLCKGIVFLLLAIIAWQPVLAGEERKLTLSELKEETSVGTPEGINFRVEGVVRAVGVGGHLVMLDDGITIELLELLSLPSGTRPGDRLVIRGENSVVSRGPVGIRVGSTPVVDLDGLHPPASMTGKVFLTEGMRGIRMEWFNGIRDGELAVEWECGTEGAEMARTKLDASVLFHRDTDSGEAVAGLQYSCFTAEKMTVLPTFSRLSARKSGVVKELDVGVRTRMEMVGVIYEGLIRVPATGIYQFHVRSDDGSRLYVSDTPVSVVKVGEEKVMAPENALDPETVDRWVFFEGKVNHVARMGNRLEMEVAGSSQTFHVVMADGYGLDPKALFHKSIRITGIRKNSGILAVDSEQLEVMEADHKREQLLTRISEIRQLQPDEAAKPRRVEIQGVVTKVASRSMVVQDATGGVYVHYIPTGPENTPYVSELWRIRGRTGPGDFSPVIHVDEAVRVGDGPPPLPVQPTRQQLASGSLDAEVVELEGVVTAVSENELHLLTPGGKARLDADHIHDLPTRLMEPAEREALVGSVVRIRGVYTATWDPATGIALPNHLRLGNASMCEDEPASEDPFSAPFVKPSDMLLFTSHPSTLKRVRVAGQLLSVGPQELLLFDGTSGFRVMARNPPALVPGDQVEASGFIQLGGPSPSLLEASARKVGHSPLPPPVKVLAENLPDQKLDATRVEIAAVLLSDTIRQGERALEMRAGSNRFVAYVPAGKSKESIEQGSILRLTGAYVGATADRPLSGSDSFEMRLNDAAGIAILKRGPWWTPRHTAAVIALLFFCLVLAFFWVTLLRRTVARRTSELAVEIEERELVERHRAMENERSRMAKDLHD
ncbi:MAG: hypothetical protein EOP85_00185, partial [Verrucomicrobiaceae bacterium]